MKGMVGGMVTPAASPLARFWPLLAAVSIMSACGDGSGMIVGPTPEPIPELEESFFHGVFLGDRESGSNVIRNSIGDFTRDVGEQPGLVKTFHRLDDDFTSAAWSGRTLREVVAAGATNFVALDLQWAGAPNTGLLRAIAAGEADGHIRRVARELRDASSPILLEPGWEMNGDWSYPWQGIENGGQGAPALYVAAWQHMVEIFRSEGAHNVRWVFSPNVGNPVAGTAEGQAHWNWYGHYYPGNEYVDYLGLHGFNAPSVWSTPYITFRQLFDSASSDRMLSDMTDRYPRKPIIISEFAAEEGPDDAKAEWIRDAYRQIANHGSVVGAIWFNMNKETDWRVDSSQSALAAYRTAIADLGD